MSRDALYLERMRDAVRKIESFTEGYSATDFGEDAKTQSAVILQLMLIGEMSKKLSPETKSSISLPWKEISGFRDQAIHDYFDMDLDIVWQTVISDIPILKKSLVTGV